MARPPLDGISQAQLVLELRARIDRARFGDGRDSDRWAVLRMIDEHPVAATRPHVLHNLGGKRRTWLRQTLEGVAPETPLHQTIERML